MRYRLTAVAVAAALVSATSACGGSDEGELVEEGPLRACLADAGLAVLPPDLESITGLGSASADFLVGTAERTEVSVIVVGSEQKAERTAADVAAARASFGGGGGEVLAERNAIAVFEEGASEESRRAVERCLGSGD